VEESGDHIENVYTMTTINGLKMFFLVFFKLNIVCGTGLHPLVNSKIV
jgi:hypothetical protein